MFETFFKGEALLIAPILIVLSGAAGHAILQFAGLREEDSFDVFMRPAYSILFGSVVIGVFLYISSLFGLLGFNVVVSIIFLQISCLFIHRGFVRFTGITAKAAISHLRGRCWRDRFFILSAVALLLLFFIFGLLTSTRPSLDADTASTYITAANLFIKHGQLIDVGHAVGNMAKGGFLHLAYGMLVSSTLVAHGWLFSLTAIGALVLLILLFYVSSSTIAFLLLAGFLTSNFAYDWLTEPAKFDGLTLGYSAAVLATMLSIQKHGLDPARALMFGGFSGALANLSYSNLFPAAIMGIGLIALIYSQGRSVNCLHLFTVFIAGLVTISPTYMQNIILFQNPIYPFGANMFGSGLGKTIPADSYFYQYILELQADFAIHSIEQLPSLVVPLFEMKYSPQIQARGDVWLGGMLVAAFLCGLAYGVHQIVVVSSRKSQYRGDIVRLVASVGWVLAVIFWAYSQHILRYLVAALPLGVLSLGYYGKLLSMEVVGRRRWVVYLLTLLAILYGGGWMYDRYARAAIMVSWLRSDQSSSEYFSENFVYGGIFHFGKVIDTLNKTLKPGAKILSFIVGNSYFDPKFEVFIGNGSNALPSPNGIARPLTQFRDWEEWSKHLVAQGFDYVLIHPKYLYLTPAEEPPVLGFIQNQQAWWTIDGTLIYKLCVQIR